MSVPIERQVELPASTSSPAAARSFLRDVLQTCEKNDWLDAAELALSELTTNVVVHAHTSMIVRVSCRAELLRVEVEDRSPTVPASRHYGAESSTGRGLALVSVVANDHGTIRTENGKIVWFSITGDPAAVVEPDLDALLDAWGDDDLGSAAHQDGTSEHVLVGFPPTLWLAAAEMHDALLRELLLYRSGRGLAVSDLASADVARFAVRTALDRALASDAARHRARSPLPPEHPARLLEVPPRLDLSVVVGPGAAEAFAALQDVLDESNRLAVGGLLLTRPALPEVVAVRDWVAEQMISSLAGESTPMRWPGADAEHFAQDRDGKVRDIDYDVAAVTSGERTAIVVDGQNRILGISPSLASQIGWAVDDLIGRRVVAIVPPRYREAHVAGVTRHLSTGQAHALGVDLTLPVLRADRTEMMSHFWIDADRTRSGQPVYIAYVTAVEA